MHLCAHHVFCSCCQQWLRYGLLSIKAFFANPLQAKVYYFQLSFFLQNCFAISPSSFCTVYLKQFCNNYTVNIIDKRTDTSWDIFMTWKINSWLVWAAGPGHEKKVWGRLRATFEGGYFNCGKKNKIFWKHCSVRSEKLHRKKVKQ